jgi:hypothetical protein
VVPQLLGRLRQGRQVVEVPDPAHVEDLRRADGAGAQNRSALALVVDLSESKRSG